MIEACEKERERERSLVKKKKRTRKVEKGRGARTALILDILLIFQTNSAPDSTSSSLSLFQLLSVSPASLCRRKKERLRAISEIPSMKTY